MHEPNKDEMDNVLERQRSDFLEEGAVGLKTRIDRLEPVSYTHLTLPTSDLV